eukprot:Em0021g494a
MIDLLEQNEKAHHQIRLNWEFRSDLQWWTMFSTSWNGVSYLTARNTVEFASDASGTWGCGALYGGSWFQLQWDSSTLELAIVIKELLPIVVAAAVWGLVWRDQAILCHCDDQVPLASKSPVPIPSQLLEVLLDPAMDWTSPGWTRRFRATITTASPPSTHRSYDCALRRFNSFCVEYNVFDPFPVNEKLLCYFATKLANDGLAPQTIKVYLSAIRSMQLSLGLPPLREESTLPMLKRVLDGIRRTRVAQGLSTPRIRLPITIAVLRQIRGVIDRAPDPNSHAFWAVATVAFFGFFRLGELLVGNEAEYTTTTHLSWGDVATQWLPWSKYI